MAPKRKQGGSHSPANRNGKAQCKPDIVTSDRGPASTFVTLRINPVKVKTFLNEVPGDMAQSLHQSELQYSGREEITRQTRGAWHKNRANPANTLHLDKVDGVDGSGILKAGKAKGATTNKKKVHFALSPSPANINAVVHATRALHSNTLTSDDAVDEDHDHQLSSGNGSDVEHNQNDKNHAMSAKSAKPSLKLKLGTNLGISNGISPAQTPNPQSAVRTPSIKLNFGSRPSISADLPAPTPTTIKLKTVKTETNGLSSATKRKRQLNDEDDDEIAPKQPARKLTLKTNPSKPPITPAPIFKLKTKGKIPKRPAGVGYDSELEDREVDPVILEGFILRMPPGPDCDYVQLAIQNGSIGVSRAQGGADIRMRFLDTAGRRGIIIVNGHQYATTVVDLPCIIEGMKSWDKKGWIKSIDITQMMLVLGRCDTDEQAKNFALPGDVDPKTFSYAHGLTAPMHHVRNRRFARTKRARVDDIESVERRVHQLLEADAKAVNVSFQILNHNPELDQEQDSGDDYDDEQDAEGEEDDYFGHDFHGGEMAATPIAADEDGEGGIKQDEIDMFEAAFLSDDENDKPTKNGHTVTAHPGGLQPSDAIGDTSIAVISASASPAAITSAAITPGTEVVPSDQPQSSDEDDSDADDDSDKDDAEKDADENLQQAKERIADMEDKIREQTEQLRRNNNSILRKKLASKIQALREDVAMMKKSAGLAGDDDGDDEGED